jgi:membrane carboxypeptidase/penicillin-binding protein
VRLFVRVLLVCLGLLGIVVVSGLGWLFFYSRDLPDFNALSQCSPAVHTSASDPCQKSAVVVIPYDAMGRNLRTALDAVEASENGPSAYEEMSRAFSDVRETRLALSVEIARTMFCSPERAVARDLKYLRTAMQLDRRFSRRELFTMAANRYYFGDYLVGVQAASQHFFRKDPKNLSIAETALLAGLVRAPGYLSPVNHPDRVEKRRSAVLDAMVANQSITAAEADAAKAMPLKVAVQ